MWVLAGQPLRAEPILRDAITLARAAGDSATLTGGTRWLAVALGDQGRPAAAAACWSEVLSLARARGDAHAEGVAEMGLAYGALFAGENATARAGYERAARLLAGTGDVGAELNAWTGLGRVLSNQGEFEPARACFLRVLRAAQRAGIAWQEAKACNNLGSLEFMLGDPGRSIAYFERARQIEWRLGGRDWIVPTTNLALAQRHLGRLGESAGTLEGLLRTCRARGYADLEASALAKLAVTRHAQGLRHEAERLYRQVLSGSAAAGPGLCADAALGLADEIEPEHGPAAALAALDREIAALGAHVPPDRRAAVEARRGRLLLALGRPLAARPHLALAERELARLGLGWRRIEPLTVLARCERRLGRPDRSLAALELATRVWEEERGLLRDPEWRETRGAWARDLYADLAGLLLTYPPQAGAAERSRAAFDRIQRFKARTLRERMLGPAWAATEPERLWPRAGVGLDRLQRDVLEPGELLLDAFCGRDTSYLFAVTRQGCRVVTLPGEAALTPRLRLFRDLLAAPATDRARPDPAALAQAEREMGGLVLGEVADLLAQNPRVILVPDGPLQVLAWPALRAGSGADGRGDPLLAGHEVQIVPASALLLLLRERGPRRAREGPGRILALAGWRGAAGERLPGAAREVQALARTWRHVHLVVPPVAGPAPAWPEGLSAYDVLHLAAHVQADDQRPWRSGVLLAGPRDTLGDPYLRASNVATMRLGARLAVLSGCESAGGRVLSGEGVQGLSAAFLSAGVPAVIASLWPVDDAATADLMRRFYHGLGQGRTVAGALRQAQLEVRQRERTAHPFFWAGFTVIGDGGVRVPLERRRGSGVVWVVVAILLGATGLGACAWWRRRDV